MLGRKTRLLLLFLATECVFGMVLYVMDLIMDNPQIEQLYAIAIHPASDSYFRANRFFNTPWCVCVCAPPQAHIYPSTFKPFCSIWQAWLRIKHCFKWQLRVCSSGFLCHPIIFYISESQFCLRAWIYRTNPEKRDIVKRMPKEPPHQSDCKIIKSTPPPWPLQHSPGPTLVNFKVSRKATEEICTQDGIHTTLETESSEKFLPVIFRTSSRSVW